LYEEYVTNRRSGRPHSRWPSVVPVAEAFAVLLALLYVALRRSYESVASLYGVGPEELGMGHIEVLARASNGVVQTHVWFFAFAGGLVLLVAVGEFFETVDRRVQKLREGREVGLGSAEDVELLDQEGRGQVRSALVASTVFMLVLLVAAIGAEARYVLSREGLPPTVMNVSYGPMGVTFWAVNLEWDGFEGPAEAILLGQSDGITYLYDPSAAATMRVPSTQVTVTNVPSAGAGGPHHPPGSALVALVLQRVEHVMRSTTSWLPGSRVGIFEDQRCRWPSPRRNDDQGLLIIECPGLQDESVQANS
jgi:hypothetical protein